VRNIFIANDSCLKQCLSSKMSEPMSEFEMSQALDEMSETLVEMSETTVEMYEIVQND
jgi:predicted house-cleaning noncanonical NTP pyrophosphatase (MazG superfamily)